MIIKEFSEPHNLAVFTCVHVMKDRIPILLATHDEDDGGWQFLCGTRSHGNADVMIVCLQEIIEIDPTIISIADLPVGYKAVREELGITKEEHFKLLNNYSELSEKFINNTEETTSKENKIPQELIKVDKYDEEEYLDEYLGEMTVNELTNLVIDNGYENIIAESIRTQNIINWMRE